MKSRFRGARRPHRPPAGPRLPGKTQFERSWIPPTGLIYHSVSDSGEHIFYSLGRGAGAGLANFAASIATFNWTSVNSVVACPVVQVVTQLNGTLTRSHRDNPSNRPGP